MNIVTLPNRDNLVRLRSAERSLIEALKERPRVRKLQMLLRETQLELARFDRVTNHRQEKPLW